MAEAESRLKAFIEELYELRNKRKITAVYIVARVNVKTDDGKGPITTCWHCGSELEREGMAAFALGFEQRHRKERVLRLME